MHSTYCVWCHECGQKRKMFKIRDGPLDWYTCNVQCAEKFAMYRGDARVFRVVWQGPRERKCNIDELISRLSDDGVCTDEGTSSSAASIRSEANC